MGASNYRIAELLGIDEATLYRWKYDHPDFCESLEKGRQTPIANVVSALYQRAVGYEHEEVDIKVIGDKIVKTPTVKRYPPDLGSMVFFLKNRDPDNWKDKREQDIHTDAPPMNIIMHPGNLAGADNVEINEGKTELPDEPSEED